MKKRKMKNIAEIQKGSRFFPTIIGEQEAMEIKGGGIRIISFPDGSFIIIDDTDPTP